LAGRILCAPSQVSYVLNTRFTVERGFKVESRRGVNGFVRIVRLSERQPLPEQVRADDVAEMPREGLRDLTLAWRRQGIISERERRFINTAIDLIFEKLPPDERPAAVRRLLAELI
ncbi:MAG: CtsR family transcriptional regulator, partial [Negativicutes bacterium]|nr:CtsR family transcriptional regulator [Negativicutes bacterium]